MPSDILLRNVPEDILLVILRTQFEIKSKKKVGKYSQGQAVFQLIRAGVKAKTKQP